MYTSTNFLVSCSLAFPNTLVSQWLERQQAMPGIVLPDHYKLLCGAVVFCLLHQLSFLCSLFPLGVQLQLNSCSNVQPRHTCLLNNEHTVWIVYLMQQSRSIEAVVCAVISATSYCRALAQPLAISSHSQHISSYTLINCTGLST